MSIKEFIEGLGYHTRTEEQEKKILEWADWYEGFVKEFHSYTVNNGKKLIGMTRLSMGMAKYISEDWANLLFNEKVKIAAGSQMDKVLSYVFEQNNFYVKANQLIEQAFALGTGAFVEYLSSEGVVIDYVRADMIYPLTWENGYIKECAFASERTDETSSYYIQIHEIENGQYVIKNYMVDAESGKEIDLPDNIQPIVYTGSTEPLFQIITPNIVNNVDMNSPMGISIYGNALPQLKGLDLVYDSYMNEFSLGKKRIMLQESVAQSIIDDMGVSQPIFDTNDVAFTVYSGDSGEPIKEINMTLRASEHELAMQRSLDMLSLKCGLGTGRYKFDGTVQMTATQIIMNKDDLRQSVNKHQLVTKSVLTGLVTAISFLTGVAIEDLNITFDDSVFRSLQSEREQDMRDLALGVMTKEEYRAKWYGETVEQAKKNLPAEEEPIMGDSV